MALLIIKPWRFISYNRNRKLAGNKNRWRWNNRNPLLRRTEGVESRNKTNKSGYTIGGVITTS